MKGDEGVKEDGAVGTVKTIGIIGAGQLGLMLTEAAHELDARTICLDPDPEAPAFAVSDGRIVARYDDVEALQRLADESDVVTYEFENVPSEALSRIAPKIKQGVQQLYDSQDRLTEKENACKHGLKTPKFAAVDDEASLREAIREIGFPCVLKTRRLGYDGHGQEILRCEGCVERAVKMLDVPCILEEFVKFDFEASVILVADETQIIAFPVGQNIHKDGILDESILPLPAAPEFSERMVEASKNFMRECGYLGILAIEYFVKGDEFYFNEMAPRPHNSGHWTIEGATTSQFREMVHFLLGEPLEEPRLVGPTRMWNVLGRDMERVPKSPAEGEYIHMYGKKEVRPLRKMGHVTTVKR